MAKDDALSISLGLTDHTVPEFFDHFGHRHPDQETARTASILMMLDEFPALGRPDFFDAGAGPVVWRATRASGRSGDNEP
ncbi:hypothetical protein ACVWZM_004644 [Bradyrhizobium sp. USDA 4501]